MTDDRIEGAGGASYGATVAAGLVGVVAFDALALMAPWGIALVLVSANTGLHPDVAAYAAAAALLWTGVFPFAQFGWALPVAAIAHFRGQAGLAAGVLVGSALVSLVLVGCMTSLVLGIASMCGGMMV